MDKIKYVFFALTFFLLSCKSKINQVQIKQFNSNQDVILWYSKEMQTIWAISVPLEIKMINNTSEKKMFFDYKYLYYNILKGKSMKMYLIEKDELVQQSISKKKYIDAKSSNEYLILSKHFVDTLRFSKTFFNPYIQKMRTQNKDTLHIGTVSEFKIKHKKLFNWLTKNDSISIQFLEGKKFGERITVPVDW